MHCCAYLCTTSAAVQLPGGELAVFGNLQQYAVCILRIVSNWSPLCRSKKYCVAAPCLCRNTCALKAFGLWHSTRCVPVWHLAGCLQLCTKWIICASNSSLNGACINQRVCQKCLLRFPAFAAIAAGTSLVTNLRILVPQSCTSFPAVLMRRMQ